MEQRQDQKPAATLSTSLQMLPALGVLAMDPEALARRARVAARQNAFLSVDMPDSITDTESALAPVLAQIGLMRLDAGEAELARELAWCLDLRGFLPELPKEIARWLNVPVERIAALLPRLKELEPPGIFAKDLLECFALQLRALNRFDPVIEALLARPDLITAGDHAAIAAHCGCDEEDAGDMLAELRRLSPHPLTPEAAPPSAPPDLVTETTADGRILLIPNPDATPALTRLEGGGAEGRAADGLISAIERRRRTMARIGEALAAHQQAWLLTGNGARRRPLSMAGLAEMLDLHKSTISRASAGAAARLEFGTVPLSAFFVSGTGERSAEAAMRRISLLIEGEDPARPSSDEALMRLMQDQGFALSRRTIAKYRSELGVPSSTERRRHYARDAKSL